MSTVFILLVWVFPQDSAPDDAKVAQTKQKDIQALVEAAHKGDVEKAKALLEKGVNPDGRYGKDGRETLKGKRGGWPMAAPKWTALIAASTSKLDPVAPDGHFKIVKLLLEKKASLDLDDGYGATALYAAVYNSMWNEKAIPIALLLITSGAKVNTETGIYIDGSGDITPLHRAIKRPEIMKALLEKGADPNVKTTRGQTPLHWAVQDSNLEVVKLLVKAKADVNVVDRKGKRPRALADAAFAARFLKDSKRLPDNEFWKERRKKYERRIEIDRVLKEAGGQP